MWEVIEEYASCQTLDSHMMEAHMNTYEHVHIHTTPQTSNFYIRQT